MYYNPKLTQQISIKCNVVPYTNKQQYALFQKQCNTL